MNILYLQRLIRLILVEQTGVAELIPWLDVHQSGCTCAADDRAGGPDEPGAPGIDGSWQEGSQKGRSGDVAGANQHGYLVLARSANRELDLGDVGVVGIGGGAQLANGDHLASALGDLDKEVVRITDGIWLAVALEEAHHEAHGAAHAGGILPVPLHLAIGGQQILSGDILQQGMAGLRVQMQCSEQSVTQSVFKILWRLPLGPMKAASWQPG